MELVRIPVPEQVKKKHPVCEIGYQNSLLANYHSSKNVYIVFVAASCIIRVDIPILETDFSEHGSLYHWV